MSRSVVGGEQPGPNGEFGLEGGILVSPGMLDVVNFLEREFVIHDSDEELLPNNFQSLESLAPFAAQEHASGAPSR